jgi:hypothetical protein
MLDQSMRSKNGTDSFSANSVLNLMVLPFALIFTGYMFKDDLQIISKIFGELTEAVRDVTTGRASYHERNAKPLNEVTTTMPEQINANNYNENDNENYEGNRVATGRKVTFADEASEEKLTDREREARDRKLEYEKMSGSADRNGDDDSPEDTSRSSSSSDKVGETASSSSSSNSASSTQDYDDDDYSSSEESPAPKRKRQS